MTPPPALARGAGRAKRFLSGIRGRMVILLMAAGVPVIFIAAGNAFQGRDAALDSGLRRVLVAREVAVAESMAALDELDGLLRALARTEAVAGGDAACAELLSQLIVLHPGRYGSFWILDSAGQTICVSQPVRSALVLPDGARLARGAGADRLAFGDFVPERPLAGPGGATAAADLSPVMLLPFALSVETRGSGRRIVGGTLLLSGLAPPRTVRPAERQTWFLDGSSRAVGLPGTIPARLAPAGIIPELLRTGELQQVRAVGGETMAYAAAPLGADLWVLTGEAFAPVQDAAWRTLLQRLAELASFLLICLIAIVVGVDLAMVRPLRSLVGRVKTWRPGVAFARAPSTTEPREVIELEQAFDEAARLLAAREDELRAAIDQREALMAEIHHRVKNNLQIVSSLLNLQANRIADPAAQAEFRAARNRVRALTTLHRHLYLQHSFEAIALKPFLEELATQQLAGSGDAAARIGLAVEAGEVMISTDQAVSVALLVTEAVSNAISHAYPGDRSGTITIRVQREVGDLLLSVSDDGVGFSEAASGNRPGLGLQLLDGFARQLGGRLQREPGPGTGWSVRFPLRERAAPPRMPSRATTEAAT